MYYEKLLLFMKSKGLKQKEFAEMLGHSPNMVGKYLSGSSEFNSDFIIKLVRAFPDLDLNEIFSSEDDKSNIVNELELSYSADLIQIIDEIEKKLSIVKAELARKSTDKK